MCKLLSRLWPVKKSSMQQRASCIPHLSDSIVLRVNENDFKVLVGGVLQNKAKMVGSASFWHRKVFFLDPLMKLSASKLVWIRLKLPLNAVLHETSIFVMNKFCRDILDRTEATG